MIAKARIVYQNWRVETASAEGQMPELLSLDMLSDQIAYLSGKGSDFARTQRIARAVRRALETLTEEESEFIMRFYFEGITYREMSELTGRPIHKLEALHRRAIRKLRRELKSFAESEFGVRQAKSEGNCLICRSAHREEIDRLIASRDPTETWRPVTQVIRERFGIRVRTPQQLIGHEKYH